MNVNITIKFFAVKEDSNNILIKNEENIYLNFSKNSNITNVSKLYDYFIINNYYYIVLECFMRQCLIIKLDVMVVLIIIIIL